MDDNPGRRAGDRSMFAAYGRRRSDNKWPRHLRDGWILLVTGLVALALHAQSGTDSRLRTEAGKLNQAQHQVQADARALRAEAALLRTTHLSLVEGCNRLQIQRIEMNVSNYADFHVFSVVAGMFGENPHQTSAGQAFEQQLLDAIEEKTWTPRTDCAKAVNELGIRYRPPAPIRFVDRLPPRNALHLARADFR